MRIIIKKLIRIELKVLIKFVYSLYEFVSRIIFTFYKLK